MFLTVCLNPTLQKTLYFQAVTPNVVNRTAVHRLDVSGKGINVTRVLTQLGKEAVHLTQLGGDLQPLFLSLCVQDGLSVNWVESNSQIRFCYTVINESSDEVTELVEESQPVVAETEQRLLEKYDILLNNGTISCLIISGTKAAGYSDNVIPTMVRKAKEKGIRIILDIKGNDLLESLKYEPDVIKPNLDEFIETFNPGINRSRTYVDSRGLIIEIAQKYKCRIILTNGSRKILAAEGNNFFEVEIHPVPKNLGAGNTTGCGDAFTAGLACALNEGANFEAAINEGMRCGALNAAFLKPGVIKDTN